MSGKAAPNPDLVLDGPLHQGRLAVEASAGTGKTYSLSALVVRHVVERGIEPSQLLVVTFTRAAAAELRDRVRAALVVARSVVADGAEVPGEHDWMSVLRSDDDIERRLRTARINQAVSSFDEATISTIHGFCQQGLKQLGLRSGTRLGAEFGGSLNEIVDEVCRDLVIHRLWQQPNRLNWFDLESGASGVLSTLIGTVKSVLNNPLAARIPDPATATMKKRRDAARQDTVDRLREWVELVNEAVDTIVARRSARRELGYDDLINRMCEAVTDPVTGPAVIQALRERFSLVLVDESQDTDPQQWAIFNTAFADRLVTVGDPKQAIYRFRGADVNAYLRTVGAEGVTRLGLSTNFRSDEDLIAAMNVLIGGFELGDPRIVVHPVRHRKGAPKQAVSGGTPIEIRRFPDDPEDPSLQTKRGLSVPLARRAIVSDLVSQVVSLLSGPRLTTSKEDRPLNAGDIAVLVPSHADAELVITALHGAGVPAVRTRTGSVLVTAAADEWKLLLTAVERVSSTPAVRAGALGLFLERDLAELDPLASGADEAIAGLQRQCAQWADLMASTPFLAWYDTVRAQSGVVPRLLGRSGGERMLTDLDHIAELLAAAIGSAATSPASVLRTLEALISAGSSEREDGPEMRRIDSDARAVQVTTLHSSKGLQYPVVLLPFCWTARDLSSPHMFDDSSGHRVIDIATGQGWDGPTPADAEVIREHQARVDARADQLRLLYVGLTRAEHRVIVWYTPTPDSGRSALSTVLFDRDPAGIPLNSRPSISIGGRGAQKPEIPAFLPDGDDAAAMLDLLANRSGGLISHCVIPKYTPAPMLVVERDDDVAATLAVATAGGRSLHRPEWRRWSFTGITSDAHGEWAPPVRGGNDEGDGEASGVDVSIPPAAAPPASVRMPWADVRGGKAFGVLVHTVMEGVDPAAADMRAHVRELVERAARRSRLEMPPSVIVDGVLSAMEAPLGPMFGGRRLLDIPVRDRLSELQFDLPLPDEHGAFPLRRIGEVLIDTLADGDPVRSYAAELAAGRHEHRLAGFLQGTIDAVFRIHGSDGVQRFVVADYKTNRVHEPASGAAPIEAYHPDRLASPMATSDYPLQALLYSVAVHRFLSLRVPEYDPAVHLGGIAYLFMRGMVGEHTPVVEPDGRAYGIFAWTPPARTITELDQLFRRGGVR